MNISVIIPNYNHAVFLEQRIESVLCQTYKPFEIIILDDCSNDNSLQIIRQYVSEFSNIRFVQNRVNSGSTFVQWNKGVELAQGDLIWIAESDDAAEPELLENLVAYLQSDNEVVLAYCKSKRINDLGEVTGECKTFSGEMEKLLNRNFVMDGQEYIERFLIHLNTIPNASAVVFRKSVYDNVEGAPEQIKNIGDWLTWLKILCFGKVAYVSKPLNYFRYHSKSVTAKAGQTLDINEFEDWYGYDMRCNYGRFIKHRKIKLPLNIKKVNANYIAIDKGNMGLYNLKKKEYLKGLILILHASFYTKFQSGFIKRALFNN